MSQLGSQRLGPANPVPDGHDARSGELGRDSSLEHGVPGCGGGSQPLKAAMRLPDAGGARGRLKMLLLWDTGPTNVIPGRRRRHRHGCSGMTIAQQRQ